MSCLAYVVNVIVEGQSVVNCHTETLYCSCNRKGDAGDCDVVDSWFRPLSGSGTNDDRFGFVWIQTKPVGVQPTMDGLETVIDNAECLVSGECDV